MDLSFYPRPPRPHRARCPLIRALAPLSLVSAQPGSYYRATAPSDAMLLGLVENALGWHLGRPTEGGAEKLAEAGEEGCTAKQSGRARRGSLRTRSVRTPGSSRCSATTSPSTASARSADTRLRRLVGSAGPPSRRLLGRQPPLRRPPRPRRDHASPKEIKLASKGSATHTELDRWSVASRRETPCSRQHSSLVSLLLRQPDAARLRRAEGRVPFRGKRDAHRVARGLIAAALEDPAAPLYLGSNDGWVEAQWECSDGLQRAPPIPALRGRRRALAAANRRPTEVTDQALAPLVARPSSTRSPTTPSIRRTTRRQRQRRSRSTG